MNVAWFPTWDCNNSCSYCWVTNLKKRDPKNRGLFLEKYNGDTVSWSHQLNNINYSIIDVGGGEPFLCNDMVNILKNIHGKIGITTNLSILPISEFIKNVHPDNITGITVSFHPQYFNDDIVEKLKILKDNHYYVYINFVACPDNIHIIDKYYDIARSLDIGFNIEPYFDPFSNQFYSYKKEELEIISRYTSLVNNKNIRAKLFHNNLAYDGSKCCSAGVDRMIILPNGDIYPCITKYINHQDILGNIFTGYRLLCANIKCNLRCNCAGDIDKVKIDNI